MQHTGRTCLLSFCVLTLALAASLTGTQAVERQVLHGQVPAAVRQSPPLGRVGGATRLNLAIGLPLRNQPALTNLLHALYDPASPQYRKFLTPAEFAERFGPSQADYEAVMAFAKASGFKVTTHPNRLLLSAEASAADLEKALHVTLRTYQHPSEKRTFYAPDAEPSLDLAVPVLGISGLNDFVRPRPRLQAVPLANAPQAWPNAGTGPSGGYMGKDFRNAYVPNSSLLGAGQTVGLLQFDGYSASDITYYETKAGLPNVPLVNVLLDGFSGWPTGSGGEVEVSLDIEMAISMAPGLSQVIVYMAGPSGNWHDILNRMATDNLAKQLSCSWYSPYGSADPVADQIWQQMAAQGQSFFNASGDDDAYSGLIDFPGDTPYITQVGGTTLTMSANGGTYVSETVWNRGNGTGSGGGISTTYPIPSWQASLDLSAAHGSSTRRNTPDVALVAESVYVRANGADYTVGGTSCAAPLWAGFAALANQRAATVGKPSLGFLNPALYAIGSGAAYSSAFHDTTVGNNTSSSSPSQFYAVTGYDLCTGWGTPAGQGLIDLLVPPMLVKLPVSVTEGDGLLAGAGQVQLPAAPTTNLTVTLVSSDPARVAVPASVVIVAGQTNAAFDLTMLDAGVLEGTQTATVTALTPTYGSSSASLLVYDKESALLQVLLPASVIKGQGQLSGTVQVSAPAVADVAVSLSSTCTNLLQVPASVLVPAGQTSAVFTATVLTDGQISGSQAVAVTAHVQNWVDGTNLVSVLDNLNLAVRLPASAAENAGTLTNAGAVVLAGTTNADVVVALGSGNPAKLTVPATVTIPAGSLSNTFSLMLVDNPIADGHQWVSVTATVPGFTDGSASLLVLDDESPPIPAAPHPGDLVLDVPANTNLSWSSGNQMELVTNGGFETGTLTNWVVASGTYSKVVINDGTYDPPSPDPALPPYAGGFSVLATESGAGTCSLYQDVAIPAGVPRATLSWAQRVRNFYSSFNSLQQFRVELRDTTNNLLAVPFTTQATDSLLGDWGLQSCDVTAYAGRTVRLAFVINAKGYYLDVHLDNVSLQIPVQTGGPITNDVYWGTSPTLGPAQWLGSTTNSAWTLPLLGPATTYYWQIVSHRGGSAAGPVWQFTTRGVDHFAWAPVGSPQVVGQPFPALLTAQDAFNSTVSNFTGTVALSGWDTIDGAPGVSLEDFESGLWPHAPWVNTSTTIGTVASAFAHDGNYGLSDPEWTYRTDVQLGNPGDVLSWWVRPSSSLGGRAYLGFGASAAGCWSVVAAPNSSQFILQRNTGYGFNTVASVAQSWQANKWYRVGVQFFPNFVVACNLYDSDGWTLLNSFTYTNNASLAGGVAMRSFEGFSLDTLASGNPARPIAIAPTNSGNFANGVWSGNLTVLRSATNLVLVADDGQGHTGTSAAFVAAYSNQPPILLAQPTDKAVLVGSTVAFSVLADGSPPFSYQWRLNGTNLGGATATSLSLTNVQFAQAGSYAVLVTNTFGATLSSNALLTVNPLPPCGAPPAGLISWWRAEGDGRDFAGANHGCLSNGVSFAAGEVGQAFSLNGVNQYVAIPDAPSLRPTSVTVEGWFNFGPKSSSQFLVGKTYGSGFLHSYGIWYDSFYGTLNASICTAGGFGPWLTINWTPVAGVWHHLAYTFDSGAGTQVLYVDGMPAASGAASGPIAYDGHPMTIGADIENEALSFFVGGLIDEVALYDRALSLSEVQAIYQAGAGGKCAVPVAPSIVSQPANQTTVVGGNVTFSVTAGGTVPLSCQWLFNGAVLDGQTGSVLGLNNVQLTHAGSYAVLVTNLAGAALSSNALLSVAGPPPCTAPSVGLISWWRAEGEGSDFAGANHAILSNGVSFALGKVGQAFRLNGVNQFMAVPDSPLLRPASLTVEGWFNFGVQSGRQQLIGKAYGSGGLNSYGIWCDNDSGTLNASICPASGWAPWLTINWTPVSGVWHHIAYAFDSVAGTQALYVDGMLAASGVASGPIGYDTHPLTIGADIESGALSCFVGGLIDEVALYDRALSLSEVQAIYQAGAGGKCALPVAPSIMSQPTNQTVLVGGSASFSVTAAGTMPLSCQWLFNGAVLDGQTNAVLGLSNVQLTNAGSYAVLITNLAGAALSSNALLSVAVPPPCTAPSVGLISWWRAEGDGSDFVGANHGILSNGVSFAAGKVGQAFSLNGVKQFMAVPDSPLLRPASLTVEGWFNFGAKSGLQQLFGKAYGSATLDSYGIWYDYSAGALKTCIVTASGNGSILSYGWTPVAGMWHHLAYTFDSTTGAQALYVDGVAVRTGTASEPIAYDTHPLLIGADIEYGALANFLSGLIDEVALYDRALSLSEVQSIYQAGPWGKCAVPVAPSIISQPASQAAWVGSNVTFRVTAVGAVPLSYQWLFNGAALDGQTNPVLGLSNVQLTNVGSYAVLVTNLAGLVLSSNALLSVSLPPPCTAPSVGLISWWRAEGDGSDFAGANHAILSNGVSFAGGNVGQAFSLNGVNQFLAVPDSPLLRPVSLTVEGWFNFGAKSGLQQLIGKAYGSGGLDSYAIWYNGSSGTLNASIGTAGGFGPWLTLNWTPVSGVWHHLAYAFDSVAGTQALYVDGILAASGAASGPIGYDSHPLTIGADIESGAPSFFVGGLIDEVALYDRALSWSEVQAIYQAGVAGKCAVPVAPSIISQPANQTALVSSNVTFSVAAGGTVPLSYQWLFNGAVLDGQTNPVLGLSNVQLTNAGSYAVLVTNLAGAALSSNALLNVTLSLPCTTSPAGLICWWRAEGDGSDSAGANHGILSNGVSFAAGKVGQAFSLNGANQFIAVPDSLQVRPASLTVEGWFNFGIQSGMQQLIGKTYGSGVLNSYGIWYDNDAGTLNASICTASGWAPWLTITWTPVAGVWHHLAHTFDSGTGAQVLYVDGILAASGTASGPIAYDSHPLTIGADIESGALSCFVGGLIDEVALYGRALSWSEVQTICQAGAGGKCAVPVAPSIISQPASQAAWVGSNVTFNVTAGGAVPLSYQWLFNGAALDGQTNPVLGLSNVQLTNAGSYAVLVTNLAGLVVSSNALLSVTVPPPCTALPAGLISWWRAEGNGSDFAGLNHGILSNGVSFAAGQVGQAFSLNGVNQFIAVPDSPLLRSASLTVEGWFNFGPKGGRQQLVGKPYTSGYSGLNTDSYSIWYDNSVRALKVSIGGYSWLSYTWTPVAGVWHHLALTFDFDSLRQVGTLYVDGVAVATGTALLSLSIAYDNHPLLIGADIENGALTFFMNGLADEVAVYGRVLSASEVKSIYSAGMSGKCPQPIAPSFIAPPTNQTVSAGISTTFAVTAVGGYPLSYQWRHNGTNLPGQTSSALVLPAPGTNDAGSYSVVVTNAAGAFPSADAVLTVVPVPPCATPGLLAWWAGEGNAADQMGVHNGTLIGSVTFTNGEVGQALAFNGSSAVDLGSWFNLQVFSVAMWVKPAASQVPSANIIDNNSTSSRSWTLQYDNPGLQFHWGFVAGNLTFTLTPDTWQYLVLTMNSNRLAQVYINGQVRASLQATTAIPYDGTQSLRLGGRVGGGRYFQGALDEIDVYNRALATNEVVALYQAGAAGKCGLDHPPTAANLPAATKVNQPLSLALAKLLACCSDPDGDPLTVTGVSSSSTNGGLVVLGASAITYTPPTNYVGADAFTYTISDGRGGTASAAVLLSVVPPEQQLGSMLSPTPVSGGYQVNFVGLPGCTYTLQRASALSGPWATVATILTDGSGLGSFIDTNAPSGKAFYRTTYP